MQFRILANWKGPLRSELADGMMTWLTKVVKYQAESGDVKSKRVKNSEDHDDAEEFESFDEAPDGADVADVVAVSTLILWPLAGTHVCV